ncbi:uncharacterized protein LOC143037263 [Oratosquilla oratoria]|uniref:uncharacterized protein LOC143037263 n=1 Tax=Oratosquilla oratoria TaxID=337810 RepID=UPI003F766326
MDVVDDDDERGTIIITEYCPGGTLLDLLQGHTSWHSRDWGRWVMAFLKELVPAVAFMHERHFVHLNIKSDNVVLDADKEVLKLIDFGLAVRRSDVYDRCIGGVLGTLLYMAPEVLDPYARGKPDIWFLGCVLFEKIDGSLLCSVPGLKKEKKMLSDG